MPFALKIILLIITMALVAGGGYFFLVAEKEGSSLQQKESIMVKVAKGTIVEELTFTGIVKPAQEVRLSFERTGIIKNLPIKVGGEVRVGNLISSLDNADIVAQIARAEADIAFEEAQLKELKRGPRPEESSIAKIKVENAQRARDESLNNVLSVMLDAHTKADDAVRNKLDQIIDSPRSSNPQIKSELMVTDSSLKQKVGASRVIAEGKLAEWNQLIATLTTSDTLSLKNGATEAKQHLLVFRSIIGDAALVLDGTAPSINVSQTTIDGYRAAVSAGRANIEAAYGNIVAAEEKWQNADAAIALAKEEQRLVEVGASVEEIAAQEARVKKAQAALKGARVDLSKTVLVSPIAGVLTKLNVKIGETVTVGQIAANIISDKNFEVRVDVPEANIAKVAIGNEAILTLDAYGPRVKFSGKLVRINPAEKIIEGVATYESTIEFKEQDSRIKSGMTANIIFNIRKDGILVIPQNTVTRKQGAPYVVISENGTQQERRIRTGSIGINGFIEVVDGLKEGETILQPSG
ncbi:MAG TPA: efflux RND transporter periplasmic adaptor subunit [Candidatus Paceibacterota bacterium]